MKKKTKEPEKEVATLLVILPLKVRVVKSRRAVKTKNIPPLFFSDVPARVLVANNTLAQAVIIEPEKRNQ